MDDLRGTPLSVGTLEEMIDENHAIVSSAGEPPSSQPAAQQRWRQAARVPCISGALQEEAFPP